MLERLTLLLNLVAASAVLATGLYVMFAFDELVSAVVRMVVAASSLVYFRWQLVSLWKTANEN